MIEQENINKEEVFEIVKNFKFQPSFNKVVITLNKENTENELEFQENIMSNKQFIVSKGEHVNFFDVGDEVLLNLEKMMVPVQVETEEGFVNDKQVKINPLVIDGKIYGIIEDRLIEGKFLDNV